MSEFRDVPGHRLGNASTYNEWERDKGHSNEEERRSNSHRRSLLNRSRLLESGAPFLITETTVLPDHLMPDDGGSITVTQLGGSGEAGTVIDGGAPRARRPSSSWRKSSGERDESSSRRPSSSSTGGVGVVYGREGGILNSFYSPPSSLLCGDKITSGIKTQ